MTTDEQAIGDVLKQLEAAWNASDSNAFAAKFLEDATFIQIFGGQMDGRPAIEASHRVIFDTIYKGSHASFTLRSVRALRPGVAIAFSQAHLKFFDGNQPREMDTRPTLILVQEDGRWQIAVLQNTRVTEVPSAAQAAARLTT